MTDRDPFDRIREAIDEMNLEERLEEFQEQLEEEMENREDTDFDTPFGDSFDTPFDTTPFETDEEEEDTGQFMSEVYEEADEVVVLADFPEFEEDQLRLVADEERLRVEATATEDMYHDSVTQVFEFPVEVDENQADADFTNGFLEVRLPREDSDDHTTITIE